MDGGVGACMADMLELRQTFLVGNAATSRGDGKKERGSSESGGRALPAVGRLGRASPPLFVWLGVCGARGNQEKRPAVLSALPDGLRALQQLCTGPNSGKEENFGMAKIVAVERTKGNKTHNSNFFFFL